MDVPIGLFLRILNPIISPITSFFFHKPRLYVEFLDKGNSSGAEPNNSYRFTWRHELRVINNSNYDAYNLKVDEPLSKSFDRIEQLPKLNNLEKRQHIILKTSKTAIIDNDIGNKMRRGELPHLFPPGCEEFALLLEYENEKGRTFYTLFNFTSGVGTNVLYFKKPVAK